MKFYIDSRDRSSGTNTNFTWSPPISLDLGEPHIALLDTTLIPNSFPAVIANYNDKIYLYETEPQGLPSAPTENLRVVTLEPGHYSVNTLPAAVANALNAGRFLSTAYTVVYNPTTSKLSISNTMVGGSSFAVWGREFMKSNSGLWPTYVDPNDLQDAGWVIGFLDMVSTQVGGVLIGDSVVNVATHHNLFIRSSNLGASNQMFGPHGACDIVKRVVMTAPPNALNFDFHSTAYDVIRLNAGSYSSFDFRLCDYSGRIVDLQGQPWSFSLCIHPA